jgi:endonuclease/exonuclease/phosphatase family metal-dependent hydrolase
MIVFVRRAVLLFVVLSFLVTGFSSPATANSKTLTFATYNVLKADKPVPSIPNWSIRRERVFRTIVMSGADVMGLTEATHQRVREAKNQWEDIQNMVRPYGWVAPEIQDHRCGGEFFCINTSAIIYNSATVRQYSLPNGFPSAGFVTLKDISHGFSEVSAHRKVAYAYLEGVNGTGPFLVFSVHLTNNRNTFGEQDRVFFGAAIGQWAAALNERNGVAGIPLILLGDLNSYDARQPYGVQRVLMNSGWKDSAITGVNLTPRLGTINITPRTRKYSGFPPSPWAYRKGKATRLDYVFVAGNANPLSHEVVVWLNPNGTFDENFRGSDHNLVRAVVAF